MRIPTFAPAGTDLSPRLARNRRGRDLVVGDIHGHFATLRRALAELEIGETRHEYIGPVEGVRAIVTGHTPVPEPAWHENALGIDTGVHIDARGYGRLTIARIDGKDIETWSFAR